MTGRAAASARRITADKVGILIGVLTIVAVLGLPFAVLRPNRIAAGTDLSVFTALPALQGAGLAALWIVGALWAMTASRPTWRLLAGCAWLATLAYAVGAAATHVVAPDDTLARVSPSSGVWLLLFAWAVLVADALARLAFGPWRRLAALVVAIAAISVPLASGWWDGLSVMREYAVRSDDFWIEAIRHVSLTGASVAAALVAGVPLGIACARIAAEGADKAQTARTERRLLTPERPTAAQREVSGLF